jgi:hypothetical protein
MPNWVFNNLVVTGTPAELDVFKHEMAEPYQTTTYDYELRENKPHTHESPLSFWNVVAPEDTEWYHKDGAWYEWNIEHWGCKWDASNVYLTEEDGKLAYDFDTPWSIPLNAMKAMSAKYPNLTFDLYSEEEQGWGAEIVFKAGKEDWVKEWDIPQCHADYVALDRECTMCESGFNVLDIEDWFSDCPRPDKEELEKLIAEAEADNERIHLMIKGLTNTPPSDTITQEVM